jgi:hypothetical protein
MTFLGPPDPVEHAGGILRITSVDVFEDGLRVRILFWVPDDTPFPGASYEAHRADMLARYPHIDSKELDGVIEARWLGDLLGDHGVSLDDAAAYEWTGRGGSGDSGPYGVRTLVRTIHLPVTPIPRHLAMTWGDDTLELDVPPVEPSDA